MILRGLRWLGRKIAGKAQRVLLRILSAGPIPQHVGFIMDGNRRHARQRNMLVQEGHKEGFAALRRVLEICLRLNIRCVSVYAFAIENFNRPQDEVDALFELAETKLVELCQHGDLLDEYGVRLNVIGRKELFPESVCNAMVKAENMTRRNNRALLNVCMAYASTDEITYAVESAVRRSLDPNSGASSHISVKDINSQLMTSLAGSPPLDVLVRSSGVHRFSDFLTWQSSDGTQIHFCKTYWPDFGLLDFVPIILNFQRKIWSSKSTIAVL